MTLKIFLIYWGFFNLTAFFLYVADKIKAKNGSWRIKERTLLCWSFFGGAVGGWLAMNLIRHKTRKWYFHFLNLLGIVWQVAVFLYLFKNPEFLLGKWFS